MGTAKQFWIDASERIARTAAVTYYALWQTNGASFDQILNAGNLKVTFAASFGSLVLALIGGQVGNKGNAAFFAPAPVAPVEPPVAPVPDPPVPVVPKEETPSLADVAAVVESLDITPVEPSPAPAETPAQGGEPTA